MKQIICLTILICSLSLTLSERQSPLGNLMDGFRTVITTIFGGKEGMFGKYIDQAFEMFQYDDWKERITKFLEENAGKLSKRGQQEFEAAVKNLISLKSDPDTTKEDYKKILEGLKSQGE